MRNSQYSRSKKGGAPYHSSKAVPGKQAGNIRRKYFALTILAVILLAGVLYTSTLKSDQSNVGNSNTNSSQKDKGSNNPLVGMTLFVDPDSHAIRQAAEWRTSRPEDAAAMDKLGALPVARWFTSQESLDKLPEYLATAAKSASVPTIVLYNIPFRDCGRYSAGGANSAEDYESYVRRFSEIVGSQQVIVIVEPDAIPNIEMNKDSGTKCLANKQQDLVFGLIRESVVQLKQLPGAKVYIDSGNSGFVKDPSEMADGLRKAGIENADGFSLNISNFKTTDETVKYGKKISSKTGNKHFVIDSSRNGLGSYQNPKNPEYDWCNPPGRGLGHYPTVRTETEWVDAFLYIKYPGESDGQDPDESKCQGGPQAGDWWPDYALGLVQRWPKDLQP